ncbi:MAG TPA: hypothetical protein VK826_13465, partial [Bacteroidia bacterium]|nr:hypothetical protein [Bacteroidia bacterium]
MKKLYVLFAALITTASVNAQVVYDWHHTTGDTAQASYDNRIVNLATSDSNYVYVAANSHGLTDLDPGAGTVIVTNTANMEGYIAVYNTNGAYVRSWCLVTTGAGAYSSMRKMYIAGNGDVLVVGNFRGTTDLDPGAGNFPVTSANGDAFFARYTKLGQLIWGTSWNLPSTQRLILNTVTEIGGEIAIGGTFMVVNVGTDSVDLDPGAGVDRYIGYGNAGGHGFISRFTSSGNYNWSIPYIGLGVYGLDMTAQGEMACTGTTAYTTDFDPGPGVASYTAVVGFPGFGDFYVARYASNGDYLWHYASGNINQEGCGLDCRFDQANNIYVVGLCGAPIDLAPGNANVVVNTSGTFVAKYLTSNLLDWARNGGIALELDALDNVYVGHMSGIECFDPAGQSYWSAPVAMMDPFMGSVALSQNGKIHLAFQHYFQQDVDPGAGTINTTFSANGSTYVVLTLGLLSTNMTDTPVATSLNVFPNPATDHFVFTGDANGAT